MNNSEYIYTNDTPGKLALIEGVLISVSLIVNSFSVVQLDASTAFKNLTHEEKTYAHHLSKASWFGSLAVLFQTSPESPLIFVLFRSLFTHQSVDELKQVALKDAKMTEEEWRALLTYVAAFYSNMGKLMLFNILKQSLTV